MTKTSLTPVALLHPGQPGEGMAYNPEKQRPYPIDVAEDGTCGNVPWEGCAMTGREGNRPKLLGFQDNPEVMRVDLYREDWLAGDLSACIGKFPVLLDRGGIASMGTPVVEVEDFGTAAETTTSPEWVECIATDDALPGEPTYYVSVSFTGVRFAVPGTELVGGESEVEPGRVDPAIRDEGRAWLAQQS